MTNAQEAPMPIADSLVSWEKDMKDEIDPDFNLTEAEEISLDNKQFPENILKTSDWETLTNKCKNCIAFSATECGLKTVEAPANTLDIEVLDFSSNPITDLSFVTKFPKLVSMSCSDTNIKFAELEKLKDLEKLQILEAETGDNCGEESEEKLAEKVFEIMPELISFNGKDKSGEPVMMGLGEDEEEFGEFGEEEEGEFDELDMEEEDFDEEDLEEEEGDEAKKEGDDEPAAKRQRTEE